MGSHLSKSLDENKQKNAANYPMKEIYPNQTLISSDQNVNNEVLDPRSPYICRTPINEIIRPRCRITRTQNLTEIWNLNDVDISNRTLFTNKLLCDLNTNPIDPRSPSQFINRTPIVFDEETDLPVYLDVDTIDEERRNHSKTDSMIGVFEENFTTEEIKPETAISVQEETRAVAVPFDPRSPTLGVERTPIVFTDDGNDEIIENLIMKLSANEIQNKVLERVKNPRSRIGQKSENGKKGIYQNKTTVLGGVKRSEINSSTPKRTPLSCVANKSHLRSKSVENSAGKAKNKIPMRSYEDYNIDYLSGESPRTTEIIVRRLNI